MNSQVSSKPERLEVTVPGVKEKFTEWISKRGGVTVWRNVDLSRAGAGNQFTPAKTVEGQDYPAPHWSVARQEVITDLGRFRFVREMREVKRFRVAVRMGAQGLALKCTDASTRKIRAACSRAQEQYGVAPCYHFAYETQEAVIEVPVFED